MSITRKIGYIALALALVISSIFASVSITSAASPSSDEKQVDSATLRDADYISKYLGVTVQEAIQHMHLMDVARTLHAELATKEADTFGECWLEHTPGFKMVCQFTLNGENIIKPYLLKYPELANSIEVRTVSISYAELTQAQSRLIADISNAGIQADTDINVRENRIKVYVVDRNKLDAARVTGKLTLPQNTDVITVKAIGINQYITMIGGRSITGYDSGGSSVGATTGFNLVDSYGNRGISTAGHFAYDTQWPTAYYDGYYAVTGVYRQNSSPLDAAWYVDTTGSAQVTNVIQDSPSTTRSIGSIRSYSSILIGDWVFKYGQATGNSFGEVTSKNFNGQYVRMENPAGDDYICGPGDSGAPCYISGIAIGLLKGQSLVAPLDNAIFSAVSFLSSWGVSVLTVP